MSADPLVSIGCGVYNGEATLERALSSIVAQDYANLEILIADDGSTDRSREICDAFARRDERIRFIRNPRNLGITENFNRLFREARGQYFMWADQDDIRDRTCVRKAVLALERDPEAVLCHSHTGQFIGDTAAVKLIYTMDGVAGVKGPIARYARFLRHFTDMTIYGVIRSDALRRTKLWRPDLGSANALLFELLLQGTFIQVPEVLYFYAGRGLRNRPGPRDEYARMNVGRPMPWYYFPFLVLALNQSDGILRGPLRPFEKIALLALLWTHVSAVVLTKIVYRLLYRLSGGRLPDVFTRLCEWIVDARPHMIFVGDAQRDDLFPRAWALRGESLR